MTLMKKWLMLILKLSGRIYRLKERLIMSNFLATVFIATRVFLMEIFLMVISLPVYILIKPDNPALDKNLQKEEIKQFKLRRILAFSTIVTMFVVWVGMEMSVGGIGNVLFLGKEELRFETDMGTHVLAMDSLDASVTAVQEQAGVVGLVFSGKGPADSNLLVFIDDTQSLVYKTKTDEKGLWSFQQAQKYGKLGDGAHFAFAIVLDEDGFASSLPGPATAFHLTLTKENENSK